MNRFIPLKNIDGNYDLVNAQHIVTVEDMYKGTLQLRMINGLKYTVSAEEWDSIIGKNHIVQLLEVRDVVAIIDDGIQEIAKPIIALALTAEGKIRAVTETFQFADFFEFESCRRIEPLEAYKKEDAS